ncbi:MAG: N-acetylmuramic acid 6-phosphate etherase, partial [Candidatus Omnitrophica bacterium]|nr:N-acetylmuramic acid 6-phosphate etherase [Candidatus Omnitrophota bacterium]
MVRVVRYSRLPTEQPNPRSRSLDRLPTLRLLRLMNREDARVIRAVEQRLAQIARAVRLISHALRQEGRLFFAGAGTSGRLGVLEAAECSPTFHTDASVVQAIIAGGTRAVFRSQEGAEDHRLSARVAIRRRVRRGDAVVGISASGVTPFVDEALRTARSRRARTILVTCHPRPTIPADIRIALSVGPEVLSGSTRLKAGTATKLVLNMLTLGAMVQWGKTYGNFMVDVRPSSRKLRARALGIIRSLARVSERTASAHLQAAHGRVKVAVLMAAARLPYRVALRRLAAVNGS